MTARTPPHPLIQVLYDARRHRGLSRTQIAARTGYSVRTVEYWEWGLRTPSLDSLADYAEVLGYTITLTPKGGPR